MYFGKLPDHLQREIIKHELSDAERACPCCGELRHEIGEEVSEQLELIPARLKVLEHRRTKYACRACEENVVITPGTRFKKSPAGFMRGGTRIKAIWPSKTTRPRDL